MSSTPEAKDGPRNFVREQVEADLKAGTYGGRVVTRFPPEPNGYLHIGHAKAICIDFGIARDYNGRCHLRLDDTNPTTEDTEYVESIQNDIRWLGFDWGEHLYFASDYFDRLYHYAEDLISKGLAYVCSLSEAEIREYRGSVQEPGRNSPYRDRSAEENLDLFRRMKSGEFDDGEHVLRAKIDMSAANMKMRDPLLYRIRHVEHHRTGKTWCIYPLYDYAHCISDAIEGVTHSLCSLEFENNRDVYDWILEALEFEAPPRQYEFARLNLTGTVMSKRKLLKLVQEGIVDGWDDPRMPSIAGMRRRGYTPEAIREFIDRVGVAKAHSTVDISLLEFCLRDDLNAQSPRVMCVQEPLKVQIRNFEAHASGSDTVWLDAPYWPHDIPKEGTRKVPLTAEILIDRSDFMQKPSKGFFRLSPQGVVRLRHAGVLRCEELRLNDQGEVESLVCSLLSSEELEGIKVKGTIQWVSAAKSHPVRLRLFDRLVQSAEEVEEDADWMSRINPESCVDIPGARVEWSLGESEPGQHFQFERMGYFFSDPKEHGPKALVFNRTVALRDTWGKQRAKQKDSAVKSGSKPEAAAPARAEAPELAKKSPPKRRMVDESPAAKAMYDRFVNEYGLDEDEAEVLAVRRNFGDLFLSTVSHVDQPKVVAKWIVNDLQRDAEDPSEAAQAMEPRFLATLIMMIENDEITGQIAKEVFARMLSSGQEPRLIVEEQGLAPIRDPGQLSELVKSVAEEFPQQLEQYRQGNDKLLGFFLGKCIKASNGRADAPRLRRLLPVLLRPEA